MAREIENYYESLVYDEIDDQIFDTKLRNDKDYIDDIACVALNRLPPRYVRHHVDLAYYLTDAEQAQIQDNVRIAVIEAIAVVNKHRH